MTKTRRWSGCGPLFLLVVLVACDDTTSHHPGGDASAGAEAGRDGGTDISPADGATDTAFAADTVRKDADAGVTTDSGPASDAGPAEQPGLLDPLLLTDYNGSYTIGSGTVLIENKRLLKRLTINGGSVTLRNCSAKFSDWFQILVNGGTLVVEHCELDGLNPNSGDDVGILGDNITVRYSTFRGFCNAMRAGSNSLVEHNVISDPNTAYAPAHVDGIEVYGGSHIVIRSNQINISGGSGETGAVNIATDFGSIDDVLVEDNDLTGGTYSLYVRLQGAGQSLTNVRVRYNRWHKPWIYGTHSVDPASAVVEWVGNIADGKPLPF